jgi:N-methylhydantoinase A
LNVDGSAPPAQRVDRGALRCIGIDVGGTFTDGVITNGDSVIHAKVPTTPDDASRGVLKLCAALAERCGESREALLGSVSRFGVGTTSVTNALAQRRGRRVGLITTRGFEASIPLAKGRRVHDEHGWLVPPPPIVLPDWIRGVAERVDREGRVLRPVAIDEVQAAARHLIEREQVEAIVVSFLWAFRNPVNEDAAVQAVRALYPELPVTSAAALSPIIREFERTSIALLNAYVMSAFASVDSLSDSLRAAGLRVPLLLTHSGGGATTLEEARRFPISLALSGPASGVAAAAEVAAASGAPNVLACDMGGTSFEVAVVSGNILRRTRGELVGMWTALSMVDVLSIGAGGGSIGWVDARGVLRVGPHSAGAVPGPACYGRGGEEATVTDALTVLGYLDPARFLGGAMPLDAVRARDACARLGARVRLDAEETAWGIRQIAIEEMTRAVRSVMSARGVDPRRHPVLSYGGAAGLFAADIAHAIGSPSVLVPESASILSAFGCAATDVLRERMRSLAVPLAGAEALVARAAAELREELMGDLAADGVAEADREIRFQADIRYMRQVWELPVALPDGPVDAAALERLAAAFRAEYARLYGRGVLVEGVPLELVNLRAVGIGRTQAARIRPKPGAVAQGTPAPSAGTRPVQLGRGRVDVATVPILLGADLTPGHALTGPVLIDAGDTTVWIPGGWRACVDRYGTCIMETHQ